MNPAALDAILAEWQRTDEDYPTRIAHLRRGVGSGGYHLVLGETVLQDVAANVLTGGAGLDWFWADLALDTIINKSAGEVVN